MPYSMIIKALSKNPKPSTPFKCSQPLFNGFQLQSAFLNLIQRVDPGLAQDLHDKNILRQYSVAFLDKWLPFKKSGQSGEPASINFRVACLDDRIYPALLKLMYSQKPVTLYLNTSQFEISDLVTTSDKPDSWTGFSTIEELATVPEKLEELPKTYTFEFLTPTFFRQQDRNNPLPTPECLFGSLGDRWNTIMYSPEYDSKAFRNLIQDTVTVSCLKGQTVNIEIDTKSRRTGFVGEITYRVHSDLVLPYCFILSRVAFFSGVGAKTSRGLGLVRLKTKI